MSDYGSFTFRAQDLGLDLRDASDRVGEGKWVRLKNVRASQEALLTSRAGRTLIFTLTDSPVHTVKRLSDSIVLVGAGQRMFRNNTVYSYNGDNTGTPSTTELLYSGDPLTVIPFLPERGSEVWAYVSDSQALRKHHADGRVFNWGIAAPQIVASAGFQGTGNLSTTVPGAVGYDWRYTYYATATGAESNPSPIMALKVSTGPGTGANVSVTRSSDPQVDTIRLYRRGGTIPSQWRLTASGANLTGTIRDENSDSSISSALPLSVENDVPFTSVASDGSTMLATRLPYTAGPFLGKYILAVGDPNRPGYLYWTNAGNPDGASSANNVQVTSPNEPLVGVCTYNGAAFVMSRDNFYIIDYGQQAFTFRGRKTTVGRGVAAPWAFAVGPQIYFLSREGIYATDGESPAEVITDESVRPIFQGLRASNFEPVDFSRADECRLHFAGQDLHFIYPDTEGNFQHLIWSSVYDRWKSASSLAYDVSVVYGDENQQATRLFIGSGDGRLFQEGSLSDQDDPIQVNARTGSIDAGMPESMKEWGNVILDADPSGGTITLTPYLDAETDQLAPIVLTGSGRQKLSRSLSDTFSHSIAFDFAWEALDDVTPVIYQFSVLYRPDEEAIRHWEFPPTSHGLTGWMHVRDGYITARSSDTLTLTVEVDGVAYPCPFRASSITGGGKSKLYFDVPPVKGKLFRWMLDSPGDFRLYGEDCELRLKPWNTAMGYQLVSPFRKEVQGGPNG